MDIPLNIPAMPPIRKPAARLSGKRGLSKRRTTTILLTIVLLLMALVGGNYATVHLQATIRAASTATVRASIDTYNKHVATQGIMFGFNAQHTRDNPYERILSVANVSRLQPKWAAPTGDKIYSSPAVANGLVYVGSYDHKLYAFSLSQTTP